MILDDLRLEFNIDEPELLRLVDTAPARYKIYTIPKRTGGERTIAQPAREIKALQYFVQSKYIDRLPVHDIAMAYRTGRSIRDNALPHRRNPWILKIDFENFFNSLKPNDLNRTFRKAEVPLELGDARVINKILFWSGGKSRTPRFLSVGAPTSPAVSNAVMYELDTRIAEIASEQGVTVTRYADDITASASNTLVLIRFERELRRLLRQTRNPILRVNEKKTGLYSPGERRMVTGLVVTPEERVSIGRERKRKISALIHRATLEQLDVTQLNELHGLLAFANSVEASFVRRMSVKYQRDVIAFVVGLLATPTSVQGPSRE